jgi:hypothetical protein
MRPPTLDVIAGQTAREIRAHPTARWPILDPTDPRSGERLRASREDASLARRVCDPTDPKCGEPLD